MYNNCFHVIGIANPPGEIQEQELAWADAIYTVMRIQWKAPRYTGNISNHSFSYRIDLQGVEYSRETSYVAYLSPYSFVRLRISLYNNLYGNLSNLTAHQFRVQSYCQFKGKTNFLPFDVTKISESL